MAEVEALKRAFAGSRRQGCALGSVKSMIGHTKCAAGAAGLIKRRWRCARKYFRLRCMCRRRTLRWIFPTARSSLTPNTAMDCPAGRRIRDGPASARLGLAARISMSCSKSTADDPVAMQRATDDRAKWPSELLVWSADSLDALSAMVSELYRELDRGADAALARLGLRAWL